jgi:hypothetical protein
MKLLEQLLSGLRRYLEGLFRAFVELGDTRRNMVELLTFYAVNKDVTKFTRLKAGGTAR